MQHGNTHLIPEEAQVASILDRYDDFIIRFVVVVRNNDDYCHKIPLNIRAATGKTVTATSFQEHPVRPPANGTGVRPLMRSYPDLAFCGLAELIGRLETFPLKILQSVSAQSWRFPNIQRSHPGGMV